jgi:hypothetical protein
MLNIKFGAVAIGSGAASRCGSGSHQNDEVPSGSGAVTLLFVVVAMKKIRLQRGKEIIARITAFRKNFKYCIKKRMGKGGGHRY